MPNSDEAFSGDVRRFCEWTESDAHDLLSLRQLLLALLQGIPLLSTSEPQPYEDSDSPDRQSEDHLARYRHLRDLPFQYYVVALSPFELEHQESGLGDLCNDIIDIYDELACGLRALHADNVACAVSHWRWSYTYHWGKHAADALSVVDEYYRQHLCGQFGPASLGSTGDPPTGAT